VAVQGIEKAARRMSRLMNDLLDAARIGAGGFEVQPAFLDLIDVTRQVVEEQQATTTAHRLLLEGPERLEGMWDGQRISQVLANLISNAIKYSQGGDVCISVRPACGEVIIAVSDQGPGIDPADVSRLFQPFVRIHNARPTAGSGLGLYIAKGIVESHAGRIWVDSEPGKGSTFLIALPL
jgi:signal transduction histidine kinase